MIKDIRLSLGFIDHPKTVKLERRLGLDGVKSLLQLWCFTAANKPEGLLSDMDEDDVEIAAKWNGKPGVFLETITSPKCRWLDIIDGVYQLHDWDDHQGYVVNTESRREAARINANKRWENNNPKTTKTRHQQLADAKALGNHTEQEWNRMKAYFGYTCVRCGKVESDSVRLVKDHILSISRGGSDSLENIQPVCLACSRGKTSENIDFRLELDPDLKCLDNIKQSYHLSASNTENSTETGSANISENSTKISAPVPSPDPDPVPEPEPEPELKGLKPFVESDESLPTGSGEISTTQEDDLLQNRNEDKHVLTEKAKAPKGGEAPTKVSFDYTTGKFTNLADSIYIKTWEEAYQAIDIISEITKAASWLLTNPKNRKSDLPKFLNNWLKRANDKAPARGNGGYTSPSAAAGKNTIVRTVSPSGAMADAVHRANMETLRQVCERAGVVPDMHGEPQQPIAIAGGSL